MLYPPLLSFAELISHQQLYSHFSLGDTQKATTLGLGQTGHPEGATDYHRRPCILCRRSSCVEQFVVIDAECTFVACIQAAAEI